ncbi:hypothetical protein EMCRGX_G003894 [Ephydatia muelleri]
MSNWKPDLSTLSMALLDFQGQGEEHRNLYDEQDEYEEDQGDYDPYDDEQDEDQEDQRDYDPFDDEQDEDQEDQRDYDPYDDEQDNYDED